MIINENFRHLIPQLSADEFNQLEQNILADGIRDPLVLWGETLIDGHNRYEIAQRHGLEYRTMQKEFAGERQAEEWIILNQFGRRNLPAYERAKLALRLKPIIAEKAEQNLHLSQGQGIKGCQKSDKVIDTKRELATIAGLSHDTIAKVEKIEIQATPELKEKIKQGDVSINQAYQTVRREEKIKAVAQKIEEHKEEQTGVIDIFNTDKKYNIIYADPAWEYWSSGNKNQNLHYTTMTIDEICKLPVQNIADNDCVLFLWVTYPILQECFKVIESWGFKYSTAGFVWVKKNKNIDSPFMGCGSWTRANSELCLIATKGQTTRLDASISQIIEAPIDEHSKKPECTRKLITDLVGELPRIELFSRNKADGWDVWGNQA